VTQGLVVYSKNTRRVAEFYRQALDLEVVESESSHDLLRGHGHEVVVHAIPRRYAAAIRVVKPPVPREETPLKPTFIVRSLEAVRAAAERTRGGLKPAALAWHYRGYMVLDGWDPEGNIVQFGQPE
jgi:hypothetical protein